MLFILDKKDGCNMLICIDAGHGGIDPGAVNGKYLEKTAVLSIAKKIGILLEGAGAKIIYTRNADKYMELGERCQVANKAKADYFISVHLNAAVAKSANGIETFAYTTTGTAYKLASTVQKKLIAATGAANRGAKSANYQVLRETKMPAILIETGFISNDAECMALFKDGYQNIIAEAVANAVAEFTGLEGVVKMAEKRYNYLNEIPSGEFRDTIKKLMDKGIIKGNDEGKLDLSHDMVRMFVIDYRAGVYK